MPPAKEDGWAMTFVPRLRLATTIALTLLWPLAAAAGTRFNAIAAGDMSTNDAIQWTRTTDDAGAGRAISTLQVEVATDETFSAPLAYAAASVADNDFAAKADATGLAANQRYFYRFVNTADGSKSATGTFKTAPAADQAVAVRFGFSGDTHGAWRPFPVIAGIAAENLDAFMFIGDTMYETASKGSSAAPNLTPSSSRAEAQAALVVYNRKYLENIEGVTPDGAMTTEGQQGLVPLFAAVGHYTLIDNHELGNKALQSGGAPIAAPNPNTDPAFDVNTTGAFNNQTVAFQTLEKSFFDYHPMRVTINGTPASGFSFAGPVVNAPADPRMNGTARNYFAQPWGANVVYIQLDDRSYRDVRLKEEHGARADNPARSMLGATQLAWFEDQLKANKGKWQVIGISSPIDVQGNDGGKSWAGGYDAERNAIFKFIADNGIRNVVFLSTDDHETRISQLAYEAVPGDAASYTQVPQVFEIVTDPIGSDNQCSEPSGNPAFCRADSLADLDEALKDYQATTLPGLQAGTPMNGGFNGHPVIGAGKWNGIEGLRNVFNALDSDAGKHPQAIDFYSPNTFSYATLGFSADGSNLHVEVKGIPAYGANTFPATSPPLQLLLSFNVARE
jgi:phosphodiesterase/alkaline phosphatase D-like protein